MTGIFYGSTTGNTETLAGEIAAKLGVASGDVHNVANASAERVSAYDILLLGSSTWGLGELQDDWYDFLDRLASQDLSGKKVGFFGCGDSASYPDTFCDALGIIRNKLTASGCVFIGSTDGSDYPGNESNAFVDGLAIGLLVDDDHPSKTEARLETWTKAINKS